MNETSIIGLDLAKNVFQGHGAGADGSVIFRRKLSRAQLLKFIRGTTNASTHWLTGDCAAICREAHLLRTRASSI